MSIIYLVLLVGVALVISLVMAEAVASVTRRPVWEQRQAKTSTLELVETKEHRSQDLPFVGADRRKTTQREPGLQADEQRRAA